MTSQGNEGVSTFSTLIGDIVGKLNSSDFCLLKVSSGSINFDVCRRTRVRRKLSIIERLLARGKDGVEQTVIWSRTPINTKAFHGTSSLEEARDRLWGITRTSLVILECLETIKGNIGKDYLVTRISHSPLDRSVRGISAFREEQLKWDPSNAEELIEIHISWGHTIRVAILESKSGWDGSISVNTSNMADSEWSQVRGRITLDGNDNSVLLFNEGQRFILHLATDFSTSRALFIRASTASVSRFFNTEGSFFHF